MSPKVIDVKPACDFTLEITFANSERKIFDVKPYLDKGIFKDLQKKTYSLRLSWMGARFHGQAVRISVPIPYISKAGKLPESEDIG